MTTNKIFIYSFVLLAPIIGLQCKNIHNSATQKAIYKDIYIDQFKLTYFRQILIKGHNNSKAIQEIISSDHSGFSESILTGDDYKLLDSLTTADNEKMKMDSVQGNRRAEGAEGKRPLGFILARLNSKWLDSIANKHYKNSELNKRYND